MVTYPPPQLKKEKQYPQLNALKPLTSDVYLIMNNYEII